MTAEEQGETAQQITDQAQRLGLTWTLTPATVELGVEPMDVQVTVDGDTAKTRAISLIGALAQGDRVMVETVPPEGQYIVGFYGVSRPRGIPAAGAYSGFVTPGSTATFVPADIPGTVPFSITKDSAESRLLVTMHCTMFVDTAGCIAQLIIQVGSTDLTVGILDFNATFQHAQVSGTCMVPVSAAPAPGVTTLQARWARFGGGGSVFVDGNDWISIGVTEVW